MYSRKITVRYGTPPQSHLCPLKWLDNFSMRNFTNDPIFDETLPVADGLIEIGTRVPLHRLQESMEEWFRKKSYLAKGEQLRLEEMKGNEQ